VDNGGYGQNIAAGVEANNVSAVITELFYNGEVGYYDNLYVDLPEGTTQDMPEAQVTIDDSQMVWVNTKEVGCATVDCSSKGLANTGGNVAPYFTVCNYKKQGTLDSVLD
jgi:hypothetical protein